VPCLTPTFVPFAPYQCPVKAGSRGHYLRYDEKALRLARRRSIEKTPEFIEKYRFRAGVEATMSQYDRRTGVKHLRVRGMKAVRFCAFLKATGINILRIAAFKNRKNAGNGPSGDDASLLAPLFQVIKERFMPGTMLNMRNVLGTELCLPY